VTPLEQATVLEVVTTVLEVVLDDDVGDGVKDELNVVGVCCTREVRVNLFRLSALVEVFKLFLDVRRPTIKSWIKSWIKSGSSPGCTPTLHRTRSHLWRTIYY